MRPRRKAAWKGSRPAPQRKLDDVVIELGGGECEVVQPVEMSTATSDPDCRDERPGGPPACGEGQDHAIAPAR